MKSAFAVLLLALAGVACSGQDQLDCSKGYPLCPEDHLCSCKPGTTPHPKPPKCGKWQHEEEIFSACSVKNCDSKSGTCEMKCSQPYRCADDMHSVSEKEWQELLEREARLQSALEHLTSAMEHQANFNDKLIKGLEKIGNARVTINAK